MDNICLKVKKGKHFFFFQSRFFFALLPGENIHHDCVPHLKKKKFSAKRKKGRKSGKENDGYNKA